MNNLAINFLVEEGVYPSGVGFMGFPKAISVAPNDILCHGVPDCREIQGNTIHLLNTDLKISYLLKVKQL